MKYKYETSCVNSTYCKISNMVDNSKDITWKTFLKYINIQDIRELFPDYSYRKNQSNTCGFHIKDDWAVSFHKSKYNGKKCVYIRHSAIEYIFTE